MKNSNSTLLFFLFMLISTGISSSQPQISGIQTGTLGPGSYIVTGDIIVPAGDSLSILPGTEFDHNGDFIWWIEGKLSALGAPGDSIYFLPLFNLDEEHWGGLRFQTGSSPDCILDYCVIAYCYRPENPYVGYGAGIYVGGIPLTVLNSRISNCVSYYDGAGIYGDFASGMTIENCIIANNSAIYGCYGGGVYLIYADDVTIKNSIIANNLASPG